MSTIDDKILKLEEELKKNVDRLQHMSTEYAQTRGGSAYGVEYYEIQCRVYQSMIEDIKKEIEKLKREKKLL